MESKPWLRRWKVFMEEEVIEALVCSKCGGLYKPYWSEALTTMRPMCDPCRGIVR
jgi:hypothetical protein